MGKCIALDPRRLGRGDYDVDFFLEGSKGPMGFP